MGHVGLTCASTYEDQACLIQRYPEIVNRIEELQDLGTTVINGLDCTWLDGKLDFAPDLVYFNFPHAGKPDKVKCVKGGDGHPWLLWRHKNLMLLFFRSVYRVLSESGRICVSTGIRSWCCSADDLATASRMSGCLEIHRELFGKFANSTMGDYQRSYGDWRDDKTGVGSTSQQDMPTNSYPQQNKENEFIFTFAKTDGPFPALPLWEAPEPKQIKDAVISCRCGILAPPHVKGKFGEHFAASGDHAEVKGEEHEKNIWECMYEAVMNGQDGMRRHALGEDQFLQGSCCVSGCTTPASQARAEGLTHPVTEEPICSACFTKVEEALLKEEPKAAATA
jgi:hypothetical protein